MTVESFVSGAAPSRRRTRWEPRLVAAELLKLRKRRGLVVSSLVLTVAPMILGYTIVAVLHTTDPAGHGPAGGSENFVSSIGLLSALVAVVSIVIGVTAGTGDLRAGVFRELVLTGRSRLSLFGARVPAGLAFLLPLVALAYAVAAAASFALAGDLPTPDARLVALAGGWVALHATLGFVLGLGVSSVIGSAGPSIALLLGWQFVVAPLVLGLDGLGLVRDLLPGAAALALSPDELAFQPAIAMPPALASTSLLLWAFVPLAAGAWVTSTRDA
jgi:hypothetical protein